MRRRLVSEHFKLDGRPKRPFGSQHEAREFGRPMHQHPYRCTFCGAWHLGKDRR